jgi:hypothetical protein
VPEWNEGGGDGEMGRGKGGLKDYRRKGKGRSEEVE